MYKRFFVMVIISLISGNAAKAQLTMHKLLSAGYVYQSQSFGELGGKLLFLKNDDVVYRIGGSALMGVTNSKFAIMPKIQGDILINFQKNVDFNHAWYFLAGAEATNKYIAPKLGFTLFGIIDLTGGYAFAIDENGLNGKKLHGFNMNFTVNLPIPMLNDLLK